MIFPEIDLRHCGVVFDGATDNTAALQALSTTLADYRGTLRAPAGTCVLSGTFTVPRHASLICDGTVFAGSGGGFGRAVVLKEGAPPERIADLGADAARGATALTFSAAHGLSVGDTILLYDPADFSFSGFRDVYRDGEFGKVAEVTSVTDIELDQPLYAGHAASREVYRCADMATGRMAGFRAISPGTGAVDGWRVEWAEGVDLRDTSSRGGDDASASVAHCFRCHGVNMDEEQWGNSGGWGTYYGLSVANSQDCRFSGRFTGWRHGISIGSAGSFSIPCRGIHVHDFEARNREHHLSAADWHGNAEHCRYSDGRCIGGGLNIAGDYNVAENIDIIGAGVGFMGRELLGMSHTVRNVRLRTTHTDHARGVFLDIGGNSVVFSDTSRRGGMLLVEGCGVVATNQERQIIRIRNRGFTGEPWHVAVRGFGADWPSKAQGSGFSVVQIATVAGDPPASVEATAITESGHAQERNPLQLTGLEDAAALIRVDGMSGHETIALTGGTSIRSHGVIPGHRFPKSPHITCAMASDPLNAGDVLGTFATNVEPHRWDFNIRRTDSDGPFSVSTTKSVAWTASLREF